MNKLVKLIGLSVLSAQILVSGTLNKNELKEFKKLPLIRNQGIVVTSGQTINDSWYQIKATTKGRTIEFFTDKKILIAGKGFDLTKNGAPIELKTDMSKYKKDASVVVGEGDDEYFVFTDPECPFCKTFEKTIKAVKKHAKFYVYFMPLSFHKEAIPMSHYILSQTDRAAAMSDVMVNNSEAYKTKKYSSQEIASFNKILDTNKKLASQFGVSGTPTIFDKDGQKINNSNILYTKYNITKPLDMRAIKYLNDKDAQIVIGSGEEDIYIFSSTQCPHCKTMFKNTKKFNDLKKEYTMHFYLMATGSNPKQAKEEAEYLLNFQDMKIRSENFEKMMKGQHIMSKAVEKDEKKFKLIQSVAQREMINGTPTIFDKSGQPIADLEKY